MIKIGRKHMTIVGDWSSLPQGFRVLVWNRTQNTASELSNLEVRDKGRSL